MTNDSPDLPSLELDPATGWASDWRPHDWLLDGLWLSRRNRIDRRSVEHREGLVRCRFWGILEAEDEILGIVFAVEQSLAVAKFRRAGIGAAARVSLRSRRRGGNPATPSSSRGRSTQLEVYGICRRQRLAQANKGGNRLETDNEAPGDVDRQAEFVGGGSRRGNGVGIGLPAIPESLLISRAAVTPTRLVAARRASSQPLESLRPGSEPGPARWDAPGVRHWHWPLGRRR